MNFNKIVPRVLFIVISFAIIECRSSTHNLLQVQDTLEIYADNQKIASFELTPFPFTDYVRNFNEIRKCSL